MQLELTSLRCPQCGNPHNQINEAHAFGAEIHCRSCGTTSALIFNRQLHVKKAGERVCNTCGRVSSDGTHFCQCKRSLLKPCLDCEKKFYVDDTVCPRCGWDHEPKIGDASEMNRRSANFNEALDQGNTSHYSELEKHLIASFHQRGALTPEAEHTLKRLLLSNYLKGNSAVRHYRCLHLEGMEALSEWQKILENTRDRKKLLKEALRNKNDAFVRWVPAVDFNKIGCTPFIVGFVVVLVLATIGYEDSAWTLFSLIAVVLAFIWREQWAGDDQLKRQSMAQEYDTLKSEEKKWFNEFSIS